MKSETKQSISLITLSFLVTWLFMGIAIFRGEPHPITGWLSVLGPAIAALIVFGKTIGVKEFLKRSVVFEQRFIYYIIFFAFVIWRFALVAAVGERVEGSALYLPLLMIPMAMLTGGNEEFGWRPLQRLMEKRMHPVLAALIFVFVWWAWHFPMQFMSWDWRNDIFSWLIFLGFTFTNTFTLAVIYKLTGSVLFAVLFHAWSNATAYTFDIAAGNPLNISLAFAFEGIVSMIILLLCTKGVIKSAKTLDSTEQSFACTK